MRYGRYLLISTVHVPKAVAELLDAWAVALPAHRPVTVAPTQFGWFVSTREAAGAAAADIPIELNAIQRLGRERACDFVLLDCDAEVLPELPVFGW